MAETVRARDAKRIADAAQPPDPDDVARLAQALDNGASNHLQLISGGWAVTVSRGGTRAHHEFRATFRARRPGEFNVHPKLDFARDRDGVVGAAGEGGAAAGTRRLRPLSDSSVPLRIVPAAQPLAVMSRRPYGSVTSSTGLPIATHGVRFLRLPAMITMREGDRIDLRFGSYSTGKPDAKQRRELRHPRPVLQRLPFAADASPFEDRVLERHADPGVAADVEGPVERLPPGG
jgi:hypothetical protein